mgnify:CR=1 FL=1
MTSKQETRPVKAHFGAFILETLTMGMYGESRNAIREYIQNSFDSLHQAMKDRLISSEQMRVEVSLDTARGEMVIRDNGAGLKSSNAVDVLVSVGASRKDFKKNAGFRGIGRLAGIVICDTLTFSTKAKAESKVTTVVFHAKKLRELLEPGGSHDDAAGTLEQCINAFTAETSRTEDHFFEVRLTGFHQPPKECLDVAALSSFLAQVSPLPYAPKFSRRNEIVEFGQKNDKETEVIRLFLKGDDEEFDEVFKPYGDSYSVKRVQAPLTQIDFVKSDTNAWWGWVGRKRVSGAIKDTDTRGIRVRARNIQIDGVDVMRDIFARSYDEKTPRMSYARFAEWYVGEIFVEPGAAVPNARRDGFEEDERWIALRRELDEKVGEKYGRLAYRVSAYEQVSIPKITTRLVELEASSTQLIQSGSAEWELISPIVEEAKEIQRRITKASTIAEGDDGKALFGLSRRLGTLRHQINSISVRRSGPGTCEFEVAGARSELTQQIFAALRDGLAPSEWNRARAIVQEVTGEEPD